MAPTGGALMGPIALYQTIDDLNTKHPVGEKVESGIYKFVRVGGEYRFVEISFHCPNHADMVGKDEEADSAGAISVTGNNWRLIDGYSSTLELHCGAGIGELTKLLNRPERAR